MAKYTDFDLTALASVFSEGEGTTYHLLGLNFFDAQAILHKPLLGNCEGL